MPFYLSMDTSHFFSVMLFSFYLSTIICQNHDIFRKKKATSRAFSSNPRVFKCLPQLESLFLIYQVLDVPVKVLLALVIQWDVQEAALLIFFCVGKPHVTLSGFFFLMTRGKQFVSKFPYLQKTMSSLFWIPWVLWFSFEPWVHSWAISYLNYSLCICKLCLWHLFEEFESSENPKYPCRQG